jgi:cytochrome d ubiquinol oxidase subunit II
VAGLLAMGGILVVRSDAPDLFDGLVSGKGLAMVILSGLAGAATLGLVVARRWALARVTAGAAVGAIALGWVFAQDPYFLPGQMTLEEAAASDATLTALVVAVGVGMIILVPSLWYLYRLVLKGTLDQEFEPLDQRFRPQSAGGQPPPGAGQ